jgi:hypothetical protein
MAVEKYQGFWPLPGGIERFVDTLQKALIFIKENRPSEEELSQWFVKNYPTVSGSGSTRGYIRVTLRHSGLVDHDKKSHFLTKAGEEYLAKPDNIQLFKILDENVLGFRDTLEIIADREPEMRQLAEALSKRLNLGWQSAAQPYWRLNWLRSMGFVILEDKKNKLTPEGLRLLRELPRPLETAPQVGKIEAEKIVEARVEVSPHPTVQEVLKRLEDTQHASEDSSRFEDAIAQTFDLLGFMTERAGKPGDTDVFAVAHLGKESYSIVIDGKTTQAEKISERQINWESLSDHKEKRKADYIAVVAPSFAGGDLVERAQKRGVSLIDTDTLSDLLRIHEKTPLNLEDLRELFEGKAVVSLTDCTQLMTSKDGYERDQELIRRVLQALHDLQREDEPTHPSSVYWMLKKEFDLEEINRIIDLLTKWDLVKKAADGDPIVLMNPRVAARRFRAIADSIES